jgi:hypothetical protein
MISPREVNEMTAQANRAIFSFAYVSSPSFSIDDCINAAQTAKLERFRNLVSRVLHVLPYHAAEFGAGRFRFFEKAPGKIGATENQQTWKSCRHCNQRFGEMAFS